MLTLWRKSLRSRATTWVLWFGLIPLEAGAQAYMALASDTGSFASALGDPVSSVELDTMRGGFLSESGLQFAFSFDSVTRVNGDVLAQTSVVVPVLSLLDGSSSTAMLPDMQSIHANSFSHNALGEGHSVGSLLSPVVLQNALDGQAIETLSVLDLQLYGTANLGARPVHTAVLPSTIASLKQ